MSAYTSDCAPFDPCGPCGSLPAGFVRLRYFFGKRMGVADFVDEQRYHGGKQRFHNQRLHGAGVLCGLSVARMSATEMLLRVGKGAAIDPCGREIVVGYDQCIDLDAWFQRELAERHAVDSTWPAAALDDDGNLPLVVVLRYRDCAASPEPAPRDSCSCDASGCDFGRIREEFELDVVTANAPQASETLPMVPSRAAVDQLLGRAVGGGAIAAGLVAAAAAGCPEPAAQGWLLLASFTATVVTTTDTNGDTERHLTDVTDLTNQATLLAETALLQDLLARELAAQIEAGALLDGPEVTRLSVATDGTKLFLDLSAPVLALTVPSEAFTLSKFDAASDPVWTALTVTTHYAPPSATTPAQLEVGVSGSIGDGQYRLALDPSIVAPATPIVDEQMRPLRPLRGVFQFGIEMSGTDQILVDAPYAR